MKKKHAVVGFMLLFLCSLVFIGVNLSGKIKEDVDLKNEIIETVEKSDEIDFNQITNFEWDKMYIFTPYSNPKDILREDGISTRNSQFNIEYLDTINTVSYTHLIAAFLCPFFIMLKNMHMPIISATHEPASLLISIEVIDEKIQ